MEVVEMQQRVSEEIVDHDPIEGTSFSFSLLVDNKFSQFLIPFEKQLVQLNTFVSRFITVFQSIIENFDHKSLLDEELLFNLNQLLSADQSKLVRDHARLNISHITPLVVSFNQEKVIEFNKDLLNLNGCNSFSSEMRDFVEGYIRLSQLSVPEDTLFKVLFYRFTPFMISCLFSDSEAEIIEAPKAQSFDEKMNRDISAGTSTSSSLSISTAAELQSTSVLCISEFDESSDSQSLLSLPLIGQRKGPALAASTAKKAALSIQKLKAEVAILRDTLHTTDMSDLNILGKKLRAANNDLLRTRQFNSQLKDRVQNLELSLYEAFKSKDVKKTQSKRSVRGTSPFGVRGNSTAALVNFETRIGDSGELLMRQTNNVGDDDDSGFDKSAFSDSPQSKESRTFSPIINRTNDISIRPSLSEGLRIVQSKSRIKNKTFSAVVENKNSEMFHGDLKPYLTEILMNLRQFDGENLSHQQEDVVSQAMMKLAGDIQSGDRKVMNELILEIKLLTNKGVGCPRCRGVLGVVPEESLGYTVKTEGKDMVQVVLSGDTISNAVFVSDSVCLSAKRERGIKGKKDAGISTLSNVPGPHLGIKAEESFSLDTIPIDIIKGRKTKFSSLFRFTIVVFLVCTGTYVLCIIFLK